MRQRTILIIAIIGVMLTMVTVATVASISMETREGNGATESIAVQAAGRGNPWLKLEKERALPMAYIGPVEPVATLEAEEARALALASGDFDGDGVDDLVSGYGYAGGGMVTLHRGNEACRFPKGPEAFRRIVDGTFDEPPFLLPARVTDVPEAVDYLGVGDFNGDGRPDVVTASRGGRRLYLLAGDGSGGLRVAQEVELPGEVTAMVTGEVNRRDGLTDVVVGISGLAGPRVMVYQNRVGALLDEPDELAVPAEVRAMALGPLDGDRVMDVALVTGGSGVPGRLLIIHGYDQTRSEVGLRMSDFEVERLDSEALRNPTLVAVGDFLWDRQQQAELAVLDEAGQVHVLGRGELDRRPWTEEEMRAREEERLERDRERAQRWEEAMEDGRLEAWGEESLRDEERRSWEAGEPERQTAVVSERWKEVWRQRVVGPSHPLSATRHGLNAVRLSGRGTQELMLVDPGNQQLHILMPDEARWATNYSSLITLHSSLPLVAALPMKLNVDGQPDLVMIREGEVRPVVVLSAAMTTFTVTKTDDTNDGFCTAGDCSLREAVMAANATAFGGMIMVPAGTYTLTIANTGGNDVPAATGDLDILRDVTIIGAGQTSTIIQAGTSSPVPPSTCSDCIDRVFETFVGSVTFENLTIRHGSTTTRGGGIRTNSGSVSVSNCTLSDNRAVGLLGGGGGGIFAISAIVSVRNSTLSGNLSPTRGGGILTMDGKVMVSKTELSENVAALGGGISATTTTVDVSDSKLSGNLSQTGGGGIFAGSAIVSVRNSTLKGNAVSSGDGGGIAAIGDIFAGGATVDVRNSTLSGNSASSGDGGGISAIGGVSASTIVSVHNSKLSGNLSETGGGIAAAAFTIVDVRNSTLSGNRAGGGGGIFASSGIAAASTIVDVRNSTLSGNVVAALGGGIFATIATVNVRNSTLSGNRAAVAGGGIAAAAATVNVRNSTLSGNAAAGGGGIVASGATVSVSNSIIANSTGGNCSGTITSLGHNISDDGTCGFSSTGDMNNTDPLLGPLQDNGGPTQTHALLTGSPAIDAGDASKPGSGSPACEATDQRGVSRPIDGDNDGTKRCDIGAFEAAACTSGDDTDPPTAICQSFPFFVLGPMGTVTVTAGDIDGGSRDNCGIAERKISKDGVNFFDEVSYDCTEAGDKTATLRVRDAAGNTATCTATVQIRDLVAPTAVCKDITVALDANGMATVKGFDVDGGSSDNCGITRRRISKDGVNFFKSVSYDCTETGSNTVTLRVVDRGSNKATCTATVTVVDDTPPAISCPANITVNNDNGVCGAVVTYTPPVGTDNCPGATTTQTAGLASGSTFPVGTTTNTFVVTDAAGNTASCSFDVTVNDVEAPMISCPDDIMVNNDNGMCGAVVSYSVTSSDNCPGQTMMQTAGLASGSTFPVGMTTNTFVVTDASGNTATCSFDVTVNDVEAPTISCPSNIAVSNDAGVCGAVVAYTPPVGSDNCPGATTAQTAGLPSGSTFPVGTTTNTFVVTDAAGNTASCSFTVTVNDTEAPSITCPADISGVANRPNGRLVEFAATASDNCNATPVIEYRVGDELISSPHLFPLGTTAVTCTARDSSGNSTQCTFSVQVTAPIAGPRTAPATIPLGEGGGSSAASAAAKQPPGPQALLVTDFENDQVRVLLTGADGRFRRGGLIPVGDGPSAIALGDLNRDGRTDAIVANLLSSSLSIVLGNGDGTFRRQRGSIPVGGEPSAVGVGDFNRDGRLDLVVANFGDDTILVLTGQGDGSFKRRRSISVGTGPTGIVTGDFNRDGREDVAVSNFGSNDVTLLLGRGDGSFKRSRVVSVDAGPLSIASADLNADGQLELVTANFTANNLTILTPGGRAGFRVENRLPVGEGPVAVVAGSFLTGWPGLAVADRVSGEITLWLGDETGPATRQQRFEATAVPVALTAGDFNGDGRLDLAVMDNDGVTLRLLLDNGHGGFRRAGQSR